MGKRFLQSNKKLKIMKTIKDQNEFNALLSKGIKDFGNYEYLGETLDCSNNQLVKLPALPVCETLECSNNQLVKLPALPVCKWLYCYNNQLVKLPSLPVCETLECSNNQLVSKYFTISSTSLRSVFFMKNRNVILTGCFFGTPEEFYEKGFVNEKKQWVKDFYNQIKK